MGTRQDHNLVLTAKMPSGNVKAHIRVMLFQNSSWIIKHQRSLAFCVQTFWKGAVPKSISARISTGRTLLISLFSFSWTTEIQDLSGKQEAKMYSCCQTAGPNSSFPDSFSLEWFVCLFVCLKKELAWHPRLLWFYTLENACWAPQLLKASGNTDSTVTSRTWPFWQFGLIWREECKGK